MNRHGFLYRLQQGMAPQRNIDRADRCAFYKMHSITPAGEGQVRTFLDSWQDFERMYAFIREDER